MFSVGQTLVFASLIARKIAVLPLAFGIRFHVLVAVVFDGSSMPSEINQRRGHLAVSYWQPSSCPNCHGRRRRAGRHRIDREGMRSTLCRRWMPTCRCAEFSQAGLFIASRSPNSMVWSTSKSVLRPIARNSWLMLERSSSVNETLKSFSKITSALQ